MQKYEDIAQKGYVLSLNHLFYMVKAIISPPAASSTHRSDH